MLVFVLRKNISWNFFVLDIFKLKYDDIKKFNNGDNKTLNNLLKECKKNFMRKTNLECIYDPVKKIATNPTERYPK